MLRTTWLHHVIIFLPVKLRWHTLFLLIKPGLKAELSSKEKGLFFGSGLVLTGQNLIWTFPHVWGNYVSIKCSKALTGSYVCSQVIDADQEVDVLHQDILSRALSVIQNSETKSLGHLW
jgi:hypothetical protein